MSHSIATIAPIKVSGKDLSAGQKKFNRLTKSLQKDKDLLKTWVDTYDSLRVTYVQNVVPLLQEMDKLRLEALIELDRWYNHKALTKRQNDKLYDYIQSLAEICTEFDDSGQAEIIYNRYNEMTLDETKKEHYAMMRSEIEDVLGVKLGDDFDFESDTAFSDFMGAVNDKVEQENSKKQQRTQKNKTTSKQTKQAENEFSESQSIKEVFRQLTKVLHPDRETDEAERLRKSELMQRANISYKKQDLLSLLELQFEIEQANQVTIDNLSNERLEAYNRLLQRQHEKVKQELFFIKQKISVDLDIPFFYKKSTEAKYYLERKQHDLENQKIQLNQDLEIFSEVKSLKRWLNTLRVQNRLPSNTISLDDIFYEFI